MSDTKLTSKQEMFVRELVKGKSQYAAYLIAYPKSTGWLRNTVDCEASLLRKHPKVSKRYNELIKDVRKKEAKKMLWTREKSINALSYIVEVNTQDIERVCDTIEDELEILCQKIEQEPENAAKYTKELIRLRKSKRASTINNKGVTDAVAELNKMMGYNEQTINMNGSVVFEGENDLED